MKFRSDFVTNSSSSSFLVFHLENKPLAEKLEALGIRLKSAADGVFHDGMRIILPSGISACLNDDNLRGSADPDENCSVTGWLLKVMLYATCEDSEFQETNWQTFSDELTQLLTQAEMISSITQEEEYSIPEYTFSPAVHSLDGNIVTARVNTGYAIDREVGPCHSLEVADGIRQDAEYDCEDPIVKESCKGLRFAATGKTLHHKNQAELFATIETLGGIVCTKIDETVDYMICNDIRRRCKKMRSALELGIPVLTETAFLRRFGDISDYFIDDDGSVSAEATEIFSTKKVLDFVAKHGVKPVPTRVWKDGKWVTKG